MCQSWYIYRYFPSTFVSIESYVRYKSRIWLLRIEKALTLTLGGPLWTPVKDERSKNVKQLFYASFFFIVFINFFCSCNEFTLRQYRTVFIEVKVELNANTLHSLFLLAVILKIRSKKCKWIDIACEYFVISMRFFLWSCCVIDRHNIVSKKKINLTIGARNVFIVMGISWHKYNRNNRFLFPIQKKLTNTQIWFEKLN